MGIMDVYQQVVICFVNMTSVIFSALFVITEFVNGAIKNLVGKGYSKEKIFLSKFIMNSVAVVMMVVLSAIVSWVLGCFFIGTEGINGALIRDYVIFTLLQSGLMIALNGIVITLSEVCRNLGAGISIGIIIVGFSTLLSSALDLVFNRFSISFKATDYWVVDVMQNCPISGFGANVVIQVIFVIVLWSVLAIGAGMWHFRKADIK